MHYPLGARRVAAAADTSGYNVGALTAVFTQNVLNVKVPVFEIYKIAVTTAEVGTAAKLLIAGDVYSVGPVGEGAEWDPAQPALVRQGQDVYVAFSQKPTVVPHPVATVWLRYEVDSR